MINVVGRTKKITTMITINQFNFKENVESKMQLIIMSVVQPMIPPFVGARVWIQCLSQQ
jgi:hypothetical protein